MNDKEKIEEDDSLILAWDQYIQGQAELIENISPEFQKVIQTYFMKNNKKVRVKEVEQALIVNNQRNLRILMTRIDYKEKQKRLKAKRKERSRIS